MTRAPLRGEAVVDIAVWRILVSDGGSIWGRHRRLDIFLGGCDDLQFSYQAMLTFGSMYWSAVKTTITWEVDVSGRSLRRVPGGGQ